MKVETSDSVSAEHQLVIVASDGSRFQIVDRHVESEPGLMIYCDGRMIVHPQAGNAINLQCGDRLWSQRAAR